MPLGGDAWLFTHHRFLQGICKWLFFSGKVETRDQKKWIYVSISAKEVFMNIKG